MRCRFRCVVTSGGGSSADVVAGVTLAAVAIPETMGYTSIAQTPIVTGLYTIIFPAIAVRAAGFVEAARGRCRLGDGRDPVRRPGLARASRADSGLAGVGGAHQSHRARLRRAAGPGAAAAARLPRRLPVRVGADRLPHRGRDPGAERADPRNAGRAEGHRQLVRAAVALDHVAVRVRAWPTCRVRGRDARDHRRASSDSPRRSRARSSRSCCPSSSPLRWTRPRTASRWSARCTGGFPPIGLPAGISWSRRAEGVAVAFSCFVLIIAQSAATARSFAHEARRPVDVNRDIDRPERREHRRGTDRAPSS